MNFGFPGYNKIMDVPLPFRVLYVSENEALKKVGLFDERFFLYTRIQTYPGGFINTTEQSIFRKPPFTIITNGDPIRLFGSHGAILKVPFDI